MEGRKSWVSSGGGTVHVSTTFFFPFVAGGLFFFPFLFSASCYHSISFCCFPGFLLSVQRFLI